MGQPSLNRYPGESYDFCLSSTLDLVELGAGKPCQSDNGGAFFYGDSGP